MEEQQLKIHEETLLEQVQREEKEKGVIDMPEEEETFDLVDPCINCKKRKWWKCWFIGCDEKNEYEDKLHQYGEKHLDEYEEE